MRYLRQFGANGKDYLMNEEKMKRKQEERKIREINKSSAKRNRYSGSTGTG